jgi:subtilisin-like proprotein convertase family protein
VQAAVDLTQTTSSTITAANSVSCDSTTYHTDNSYYRAFDMATTLGRGLTVTSVDVAIQEASSPGAVGQPMSVRLYTSSSNPPTVASLSAAIATADVTVADQTLAIVNVPISASVGPHDVLVVEVFTPNGSAGPNLLRVGSNALGQTAPNFIRAADCGVAEIASLASIGFPNMHTVMTVHGTATSPIEPDYCAPIETTFTNNAPVAIADLTPNTSTIEVSGMAPYLFDVNVRTFIAHTFAADVDMTVVSPAGTVVTLTTDNGAGNDNVFDGTLWDDQANPGGQVPYTTNAGLVTDNPYVNNVAAVTLAPEEPLHAFAGENPNGTWTLVVYDDLAGDPGSIDGWALELTALADSPTSSEAVYTQSTPTAVPTGPAVVTSTLLVSGAPTYLMSVDLDTNLTHTFAADVDITLMSPAGTVVTLTTDNGAGNDNTFNGSFWTDFANPAGTLPYTTNNGLATDHAYVNLTTTTPVAPEESLAAFVGEDPNGTWTITISDDLAGDGGSLDSWALHIHGGECSTTTTTSTLGSSTSTSTTSTTSAGATTTSPSPTTTITGGSSTTTTIVGLADCQKNLTFASLGCRLGKVRKDSGDALDDPMKSKLDKLLARADAALQQAAQLHETADVKPMKRAMKKAARFMKKVGKKLGSKAGASVPQSVRDELTGVQTDLGTMLSTI